MISGDGLGRLGRGRNGDGRHGWDEEVGGTDWMGWVEEVGREDGWFGSGCGW
jgi:hypothetical protein